MISALQAFYLIHRQFVLRHQTLDKGLVVEGDAQFCSQFLTDGTAATTLFTIDRDDKFLVSIHSSCF